jgi:hypothetical protein
VTGWRSRAAALVLAGPVLVPVLLPGPAPAAYGGSGDPDDPVPSRTLFVLEGDDVFESSGLVDRGRVVFTNNDSGDDAVVYGVDSRTGRTVSRTTYADSVEDVEALAPGPGGTVWAGDTGDNRERRDDVQVYRVQPRDGETLLVHPRTGRVLVVSKSVFGGTVYAAPPRLRAGSTPNRMRKFAQVAGLVTDGTFFPDGRHVLLRTYGTASVYTYPGFELVGTVTLPAQPQGEGISVSRTGRVLVSSEGVHADVLQVTLPPRLTAELAPDASPPATPTGPAPSSRAPSHVAEPDPSPRSLEDWGWIALVAAGVGALGYLALRGSRLRGPRKR